MADSRTRQPNNLLAAAQAQLARYVQPGARITLGLSGGVDSVVLLDLLARLATSFPFQLSAIHVNHQISPHTHDWADACRTLCAAHNIPLQVQAIRIEDVPMLGLEAAARQARYAAYAQLDTDFIALAHHRDDQAETLLLQLLRGAGAKGLAAMPVLRLTAGHPPYLRPLLDIDRSDIEAWARQHGLHWVEDESNLDAHFNRNFLRHAVLPHLSERFPAWRATLSRSAQNLAEAADLLDQLATLDATDCIQDQRLNCAKLAALAPARARNLLRHFLTLNHIPMPSQARLASMLTQLTLARADSQPCICHAHWALHRYQGWVHLVSLSSPIQPSLSWRWQGEAQLILKELGGILGFTPTTGQGLDRAQLDQAPSVTIRLRQGGEHFRPDCRRPRRSLKNLLQESAIPPWQRDHLPLLYCGDTLVWVAGIGVDCAWQTQADAVGILPEWTQSAC
ncbi:MAG: tRNA lysidine(34) synthetase TilS [Sulfuriferula sp.]